MLKEPNNKIIITPETTLEELLDSYPYLENKLIELVPKFLKINNQILRKTINRVTSLRQAALIGEVRLDLLIEELRKEAGQIIIIKAPLENSNSGNKIQAHPEKIKEIYDATADIEAGEHPLAKVMRDIQELDHSECYLLITPFLPAPLIQKVEEKGFNVKLKSSNNGKFKNYIWK